MDEHTTDQHRPARRHRRAPRERTTVETNDTSTVTVPADQLLALCSGVLEGHGVPAEQAAVVADTLVEADLHGVASHGSNLLALYVRRLESGQLRPAAEVTTVRDDGGTVLLDAGLGFGQVAGRLAGALSVERALEYGTATVAVHEATHLGALGYYTRRVAEQGCVALAFQNGPTIVPPYGGVTPLFSTNPVSYAVPTGSEPTIVYDVATTTVAGNRVLLAKKEGRATIPEGWANDEQGVPTTDTAAASVRHLQWFGGHKGYGIGLLVELLAGVLAGSSSGTTERTASPFHGRDRIAKGFVFMAIDVGRFLPLDEFRTRTDALIREVRDSGPAAGVERVLVPGQLEHERGAERRAHGIPLSRPLADELQDLAAAVDAPPLDVPSA